MRSEGFKKVIDKKELIIALSMVLASAALAQDADKPAAPAQSDPKAAAQQPAKEENKEQAPANEKKVMPSVSIGWADWRFNGNSHKFTQYATPPNGLYLGQLRYEPASDNGKHWGLLDVRTPGEDDYRAAGRIQLYNGAFNGELSAMRNRFFATTPQAVDQSSREITEAYLKQMIGSNFALTFRNRFDKREYYDQAPIDPVNQRSRYWDLSARGSVGTNGFLDLSYSDLRYWDRTQVEPDSDTRRFSATYRHEFTDNLSLEGSFSHSTIDQDGFSQSKIDSWNVGGRWAPSDATSIFFDYRQDKLDLPNVLNAHDRARTTMNARLVQALHGQWSAQLAYKQLDLERYRGDLTYVDVPRIHTYEGRLSGPLTPAFRLTAKLARTTLDGKAIMVDLHNPATAYFRNRWNAQVKVDTTGELINAYLVYGYSANFNDVRGADIRQTTWTLGGTYQATPTIDLYAEVTTERWSAATGNTRTADIGDYYPDGTTWTIGGNWTINPKLFLSGGYTGVMSRNSNPLLLPDGNVHGNYFNGTLTYKTPRGWDLALTYAPATYRDRVYNLMDYTSGFVTLSASTKF